MQRVFIGSRSQNIGKILVSINILQKEVAPFRSEEETERTWRLVSNLYLELRISSESDFRFNQAWLWSSALSANHLINVKHVYHVCEIIWTWMCRYLQKRDNLEFWGALNPYKIWFWCIIHIDPIVNDDMLISSAMAQLAFTVGELLMEHTGMLSLSTSLSFFTLLVNRKRCEFIFLELVLLYW